MADPELFPEDPDPTKAYGDTSGWSGSDTSRERAERDDVTGRTHERDDATLAALMAAGEDGLTWFELADAHNLHHGEASAALSRLHKMDRIARLTAQRERCQIYVTPGNVRDRPTAAYRPNVSRRAVVELLDEHRGTPGRRRRPGGPPDHPLRQGTVVIEHRPSRPAPPGLGSGPPADPVDDHRGRPHRPAVARPRRCRVPLVDRVRLHGVGRPGRTVVSAGLRRGSLRRAGPHLRHHQRAVRRAGRRSDPVG